MPCIKILPSHVANQIAAGEVVERPSSIVKELLENSIDAGAGRIRVELEDGGKRLIRVTDNGIGMEKGDLELAFERHATSKIKDATDLAFIRTMGFRGEALPSIGAVSRLSITSRPSDNLEGWQVKTAFGRDKNVTAVGCPAGTTVEVKDLFLEIPARLRFLKRHQTELGHAAQVVRILSVSHPEIVFELLSNGRNLFRSRIGCKGPECLWPLIGDQLVPKMLSVQGESRGIRVSGYMTPPEESRTSSRAFYFFLNQRPIKSRLLWKAVNEALRGSMMKNSYPVGALFLEVQPDQVDVNVHPTKQEVRFHYSDAIYRAVYHSVQRALEGKNAFIPAFGDNRERENKSALSVRQQDLEISPTPLHVSEELPVSWGSGLSEEDRKASEAAGTEPSVSYSQDREVKKGDTAVTPHLLQDIRILGQLARSYILAEGHQGLILVDQHAAHEALIFKRLNQQFAQAEALRAQPLAFPEILETSPEDVSKLAEISPVLEKIGVVIEPFGNSQIAVRAVPDFLASGANASSVVIELIDRLLSCPQQDTTALLHDLLASMACHSAIKANQHLEYQEMKALLKESASEGVTHCPHGRPIIQVMELSEIERRFGRK